jgi:hypothetical protein
MDAAELLQTQNSLERNSLSVKQDMKIDSQKMGVYAGFKIGNHGQMPERKTARSLLL